MYHFVKNLGVGKYMLSTIPNQPFNMRLTVLKIFKSVIAHSLQLLCVENVNRKRKRGLRILFRVLVACQMYLVPISQNSGSLPWTARTTATGNGFPFCCDASLIHYFYIGTLVLLHAHISANKILRPRYSFHYIILHIKL